MSVNNKSNSANNPIPLFIKLASNEDFANKVRMGSEVADLRKLFPVYTRGTVRRAREEVFKNTAATPTTSNLKVTPNPTLTLEDTKKNWDKLKNVNVSTDLSGVPIRDILNYLTAYAGKNYPDEVGGIFKGYPEESIKDDIVKSPSKKSSPPGYKTSNPSTISSEKSMFISDVHIPFEDLKAVGAMLDFCSYFQPDYLYLNGDIIDFDMFSKYRVSPDRNIEAQKDINKLKEFLSNIRSIVPKSKIYYVQGNHDDRLASFKSDSAPIWSLDSLKIENLFDLDSYDIELVRSNETHFYRDVLITHGEIVRKDSAASARAQYEKYRVSGISGHTHRSGLYIKRDIKGHHFWMETGCLCQLEMSYTKGLTDWHHGFAIGYYSKEYGKFKPELIQINNGKIQWNNLLFGS